MTRWPAIFPQTGLNKYAIGIEIDNPGRLTKSGDKFTSWFGREYPPEKVIAAVHRNESKLSYWHTYAEAQLEMVFALCRLLHGYYSITTIVGHEVIAPARKVDPGPAFPLDRLRQEILNIDSRRIDSAPEEERQSIHLPHQGKGRVTASALNIRALPRKDAQTVLPPLAHATSVDILAEQNGWYYVRVSRTGWVKKEFVAPEVDE